MASRGSAQSQQIEMMACLADNPIYSSSSEFQDGQATLYLSKSAMELTELLVDGPVTKKSKAVAHALWADTDNDDEEMEGGYRFAYSPKIVNYLLTCTLGTFSPNTIKPEPCLLSPGRHFTPHPSMKPIPLNVFQFAHLQTNVLTLL